MTADITLDDFNRHLLSKPQLKLIPVHFQNEDWFTSAYQARVYKKSPEFYTLGTLLEAVKNSEEQFQQYPVDDRRAKEIARSVFIEDQWLMRDVVIAFYDHKPYIIGGRHRITAIANVFAALVRENYREPFCDDLGREDIFNTTLQQNIRCEVLYLQSIHDLLSLVRADNESRTMRGAEQSHLDLQLLGADANSVDSVGETVLSSELSAKEATQLAAQHFVRQSQSRLKAQTRQVLGEKIARYIMFGSFDGKLNKHTPLKVRSKEEFATTMDKAWELVEEITQGQVVVAKYANEIARQVIARLDQTEEAKAELEETLAEATDEPKPKRTRGRKKAPEELAS